MHYTYKIRKYTENTVYKLEHMRTPMACEILCVMAIHRSQSNWQNRSLWLHKHIKFKDSPLCSLMIRHSQTLANRIEYLQGDLKLKTLPGSSNSY